MIGDKLSDYTSLLMVSTVLTLIFIGTVIHMRLKARAARRNRTADPNFPKSDRPELLGHR